MGNSSGMAGKQESDLIIHQGVMCLTGYFIRVLISESMLCFWTGVGNGNGYKAGEKSV